LKNVDRSPFQWTLSKLAAARGVHTIRFRPMPVDGVVEVKGSGFEIQIRSDKDQAVPVSDVDSAALTTRERFTFAHEISHTFFYDAEFRPIRPKPSKQLLEALCNLGAGVSFCRSS